MYTSPSRVCSCMRTRSPSSAPPEKGELGSTARTPTRSPRVRSTRTSELAVVDLPTPGGPVKPTTWARPVSGVSSFMIIGNAGDAFSIQLIKRPSALGLPDRTAARTVPTSSRSTDKPTDNAGCAALAGAGVCRNGDDQGVALPTAAALCSDAGTAATTSQLHGKGQQQPSTRRANGMAKGDSTAIDVDLVVGLLL